VQSHKNIKGQSKAARITYIGFKGPFPRGHAIRKFWKTQSLSQLYSQKLVCVAFWEPAFHEDKALWPLGCGKFVGNESV
jgi:hypothetical protein